MKKLLSLPENLVSQFHQLEQVSESEYFCASDPVGTKVGSGGGTSWLFYQNWQKENPEQSFSNWLKKDQRIIIHAGGQSRRLPSYATCGKILTPIPVFRYERGQRLDQNLMDLQLPLYEKIMAHAPAGVNTLIASGDTFIRANDKIEKLPQADVICYGLWVEPELATNHGVYVCEREYPHELLYMLQKPSSETIRSLAVNKLFLMDIGVWLLSDRAVKLLMKKSGFDAENPAADWTPSFYDLYGEFGINLGSQAENADPELNDLSVAILPLPGGEFYHYGTSRELISSTLAVQNRVKDQRSIWTKNVKPHPAMFVQNAVIDIPLSADHSELWVENSYLGKNWTLAKQHILTGIPENDWQIELPVKTSIDIVPVGEKDLAIRPYGFSDKFSGEVADKSTKWMGISLPEWFFLHDISLQEAGILPDTDIQQAALFPLVQDVELMGRLLNWMIHPVKDDEMRSLWLNSERLSATAISAKANLFRLYEQRKAFRLKNWPVLAKNYQRSVFYQINLDDAARDFAENNIVPPAPLSEQESAITRLHDQMFRSRLAQYAGKDPLPEEQNAFTLLRESLIQSLKGDLVVPQLNVFPDQIVWGRSPVRIDLAGGWSDTPPYCLMSGGSVLNMAIELNGQPPLQVYIKPCDEYKIILRSIDLGAREDVTTFEELADYQKVGSPFSIPKAALSLAGFGPAFSKLVKGSLEDQLKAFGCGIEISLLAAIPKGSGLGTSSILAATVLGALSDFCGLNWDKNEICNRTLVLEQLLTTGGGWQDQYGGVFPGVKLLETRSGLHQSPTVRWTPDYLFTRPEYRECMLLYYTGITRTAKNILAEIVRGMFLNSTRHLAILDEIKAHAQTTFETLQTGSYEQFAEQVVLTWQQKQNLDPGTNPPAIQAIITQIRDLCLAYKLPGAGGGGYMFMLAKSPEAAGRIKQILNSNPPNNSARFVDISLSQSGFQVSRS
ncbi:bifunctional fucokinase/fucose-1-phosphate guanylyltransferase [Mangrovibacterium lignilyticum]|uniref:bifunctional fucokinase/fucose-1-phosphate guanylyltransferase n=1 Tax=Mangrovibacterium lignilyticum TaxID=2668052 RepID=UPI0013D4B906|nr:bifunctional fucokinase/fucose-1-phosphate guanylyltransferase [Mangrovibacterium lignilyticum]